ncbi:hypothetical protein [Stenotrophomonas sp. AB1(2024)]|uniref:hypothetical protein n=1 Tax=Stenotrophomonas sp. AB1(2024) TaxID=3132215 RepID=UPI003097BB38
MTGQLIVRTDHLGLNSVGILSGSEPGGIPGVSGNYSFGHIAIATSPSAYSFGTAHPYGSPTVEYIQSQVASRNVELVTFDTTREQETMIEKVMKTHDKSTYNVRSRNCATAVADSLIPTKLIDDRSPLPGIVFQELMLIEGAKYHFMPKGGDIPQAVLDAVK